MSTPTAEPGVTRTPGHRIPELAALQVLDALRVGPVRVERDRLVCPYAVTRDGTVTTQDLIYRFEESVFQPGDPGSHSLAAMAGAQVALNYGLFCKEIIFEGPFDPADRRFLREMAANTAREIFVKKFLEPNPFLLPPVIGLPAVRARSYLQADLVFVGEPEATTPWPTESRRMAVLSSGGKDSLLSFGLLKEMGYETHSVFVNESGKHWFTALNGYRGLAKQYPSETARVWTNSDRVFAWMARQLPFIRSDFQKLRADEYPIRLWTVAVFLFGALPVLRARGLGRLVIGDEFDTTVRATHQGIPHYDGLYDQSIYFDQALSRYFLRKQWGVAQFSLLRPMAELLIQKTLAERYPDLVALQVSCHAAHMEGETVRPCGNCEKCRRIAAMMTAVGQDPGRLGYSPEMVERCLQAVAQHGIHQERAGARHMAYLLQQQGKLPNPAPGLPTPREESAVVRLRFDREVSPASSIPVDLRKPLYRILLQHAEGASVRSGRMWIDHDLFRDPALRAPYSFEVGTQMTKKPVSSSSTPSETLAIPDVDHEFMLGEMNWPRAEKRLRETDVALLPVGAVEQHGPHLPLDTDAFDAEYLCRAVARACTEPRPLVLPLISYGVSYHHDNFKGTISIGPETLSRLVHEIGMSVARQGISKLVIINGHGGNSPALHFAAQLINRDAHIFTCVDTGETSDADIDALSETHNDVHAGEVETSTTLANRPGLVDMKAARKSVPKFSNEYLDFTGKRSVGWYAYTDKISTSGVMGDPTKASAEKGRKMWEVMTRNLVQLIESIKGLPLAEIHQKRY